MNFFRFDTLRENLRLKDDNSTMYQYDNTTTPECNAMMEQLESNTFTNLLWSLVKPYVRGKILYTPDTPATRRLVSIGNVQLFVTKVKLKLIFSYSQCYFCSH